MSFESPTQRRPPVNTAPVSSRSWTEWTQQLQAYVAWVNSQLRKKPGAKEVTDLRRELQDGTVLMELIEIVAGESIPGTHQSPANSLEMKENVERVLQFMRSRKIKMHQIRASDIVDGNMKSIMRLILALAAHFKPSSVKQSNHQQLKANRSLGIAQEAVSVLENIRRDADSIKRKMHRPQGLDNSQVDTSPAHHDNISRKLAFDGSPVKGRTQSPSNTSGWSASSRSSIDSSSEGDMTEKYAVFLEDVADSNIGALEDTKLVHSLLVDLQRLLLEEISVDESSIKLDESAPSHEQLVLYQSRLQQAEDNCARLRDELHRTKQESLQLQGMKQGLHQRLSEQQQEILEMKAKMLHCDLENESDDSEKEDMREELTEKTTMLNRLQSELERKETTISHLQKEAIAASSHSKEIIQSLEQQVSQLTTRHTTPEADNSTKPNTHELKLTGDASITKEITDVEQTIRLLKPHCTNQSQFCSLESAFSALVSKLKEETKNQRPTAEVKGHRVLNRVLGSAKVDSTKLLCFTSKSVTPSMKTVQKKLGEITLGDFRTQFSARCSPGGSVRFLFKSLDPEFGTVKEELTADEDILPGWEGKVIGWIEEDHP